MSEPRYHYQDDVVGFCGDFRHPWGCQDPLGNTIADHHHAPGHEVTPGVDETTCSCGQRWKHDDAWLDNYREQLRPSQDD